MSSSEKRKQKKKPTTYLRHRARPVLAISTRWLYVGSFSYSAGFHSRLPSSSQMVKGGAMLAGEEGGRAGEVRVGAERFLRSALSFSFRLPFATRAPCVLHGPAGGWMAQACTGMRGTSPRFRQGRSLNARLGSVWGRILFPIVTSCRGSFRSSTSHLANSVELFHR